MPEPERRFGDVLREAARALLLRPLRRVALALALLLVNARRRGRGVLPFLTLTIALLVPRGGALRAAAPTARGGDSMASVTFDHVTKSFDGTVAVDDLELEIADGEFLVLVGPSGCGKTTALRMLAGLEEITRRADPDRRARRQQRRARARDVAMVFQSYALYPHMTVYDNLAFGLRNKKVPKAEIDQRVREGGARSSTSSRCSSASRSSSPAASASASRSAGRSSASPRRS